MQGPGHINNLLLYCWSFSTLEIMVGNSGMVWSTMGDAGRFESNVDQLSLWQTEEKT